MPTADFSCCCSATHVVRCLANLWIKIESGGKLIKKVLLKDTNKPMKQSVNIFVTKEWLI